jgi:maltose alpha-D-glucosyltransferase/alpha-amylase
MKPHCPPWLRNAIFYQIFPPSYYDSNGDGIGDLEGIIRKLDYIQSLGVNALWINPCFDSPFNDAGYDVRDFYRIAPRYGTNDDMRRLVREADRRGIRVCLDLVAPHTSIDHPWFLDSCRREKNPYSNWFFWSTNIYADPRGHRGKPLPGIRGFSERPGAFATSFFWCQPRLNFGFAEPDPRYPEQLSHDHPDVQAVWAEMKNVVRFWLDMGCAGYRCDSAKGVCMGAPANEAQKNGRFWVEVHEMLKREYPDAALFCEWGWPIDSVHAGFAGNLLLHNMKAYNALFTRPGSAHSCGVPFFDPAGGDASTFMEHFMYHYRPVTEQGAYLGIPTGNHDCPRIATGRDDAMMRCIWAFLMTMPGIPFVYYGEEIGMRYRDVPTVEGGYARTGCRTPMQWDGTDNAGFSTAPAAKLYTPIDPDGGRPTVEGEECRRGSSLAGLRELSALRRRYRALDADAAFEVLSADHGRPPFVYRRSKDGEEVLVALNPRAERASWPMEERIGGRAKELIAGTAAIDDTSIGLDPTSFALVLLR